MPSIHHINVRSMRSGFSIYCSSCVLKKIRNCKNTHVMYGKRGVRMESVKRLHVELIFEFCFVGSRGILLLLLELLIFYFVEGDLSSVDEVSGDWFAFILLRSCSARSSIFSGVVSTLRRSKCQLTVSWKGRGMRSARRSRPGCW